MVQVFSFFFVHKEHPIMGQRYLTRLRIRTPTDECHLRDGVVRRTERTLEDERLVRIQLSCDGVYLRCFKTLVQRKRRQDGRQTLCHHTLATARRTYHDNIVAACRSNLKSPLYLLLTLDVSKVNVKFSLLLGKQLVDVQF